MFILLLLLLKVRIRIKYNEELAVWARVLFVKIRLYPRKKKKTKPKKTKEKPKTPKRDKSKGDTEEKVKLPLTENIKIITDIVKLFFVRFSKHLHIRMARINIIVATGDAASTAVLYGVISQAVAYLVEALDCVTNLDRLKSSQINVSTDYIAEKPSADIDITFSIRVIGVLDIALKTLLRYIKLSGRAKARHSKKRK